MSDVAGAHRRGGWGVAARAAPGAASGQRSAPPPTQNVNVIRTRRLAYPLQIKRDLPATAASDRAILASREAIRGILDGRDRRLLVICGPCSIHDQTAALEYAERLARLAAELSDRLYVAMRVYFEKPRTTIGWKGLINDPHLDGTFDIDTGLRTARKLLLRIVEMGLATATEMLDPITPQYIDDLVSWAAVGARTTESQTHRQMASGLSMPVGFKNGTDGSLQTALDALASAKHSHSFLGIDEHGLTAIIDTRGNPWAHLILRGGRGGPNYDPQTIAEAVEALERADLPRRLMVDCSHANSNKKFQNQAIVWQSVVEQRLAGNDALMGLMLESNLVEGNQKLGDDPSQLRYGVSITDACVGWESTEELLREAHARLAALG